MTLNNKTGDTSTIETPTAEKQAEVQREIKEHIKLNSVRKTFNGGDIVAIEGIDLSIKKNEFIVLLGPSGCGKTTTLRCIGGLEVPDKGRIFIQDKEITDKKPKDRNLAFVFQNIALYPHMTVRENMRFGLDMKTDLPGEKKNERVSEVAEVLGLDGMLNRKPSALSGGQQQRVSLGRAMVIEPEAFLLDEPFSALDANLRDQMQVEVKRLQRELNTSMIFVTHDQEEAMTLGDRIVVMNDSQIEQIGTPHQIYNDPNNQFVAKFIGSPSVNLIEGMIKESDSKLTFSSDLCDVDLTAEQMNRFDGSAGDSVTLGIRPEYLEFDSETPLFEAEVEVIKPTGSRDAIYLDANGQEIRGLTDQGNVEHTKNAIKISFDIKQAWLFDATGDRVV